MTQFKTHRTVRWVGRAFVALTALYGIGLILLLVVRRLIGEQWMVIALFNSSLHLLLMPALVLLPLVILLRRWRLAVLLAPAFVMFVVSYLLLFLPRSATIPAGAQAISLLTYNLHAEERLLDPMADVIRDADADIVALQEMSSAAAEQFDTEFAALYPYRALFPVSSPYHGRGVMSRYPIVDRYEWPEEYPIPVRLQWAELDVNGTPLMLFNMHAPPSYPIYGQPPYDVQPRARQISDLLDMAAQETGAVILLGDFNTTDHDENYPRITAQYHDTYLEVGWGMGFTNPDWSHDNSREGPAFIPLYTRLDYIFHNEAVQPLEARVWPTSGGSDHRPVFARLALLTP